MKRWFAPGMLLVTGLALALRLPQLDLRPMHNDEGVNAMRFRTLWVDNAYRYDPNEFHGPTLEYVTAASAWSSGSRDFDQFGEATYRLVTVAFGAGLILLLLLLADGLGKAEALWAALFTAISPAMVFYSRYYIHEMLLVFFTALTFAGAWRYVKTKTVGWALLTGAGLGLMFATKETFVFAVVSMVATIGCAMMWSRWADGERVDAKAYFESRHVVAALAVALLVSVAFFSSFFGNAGGPLDSLKTYLIWWHRAGGESPHVHPWYFYLRRLLFFHYRNGPFWSEGLIAGLAVIGVIAAFTRRWFGPTEVKLIRVIAFYTAGMTLIYTVLPYKTPWCVLGLLQGMILLAGVGAAAVVRMCGKRRLKWVAGAALVVASAQLGWQAWRASFPFCASQFNPYVYAQTSPDILKLVAKVEALAAVSPQHHDTLVKVMSPRNDYWPLPWYLRRFQRIGFWNAIPAEPLAPIMIVSSEFHAAFDERPEKTHLMAGYFQLRPQVFFELYVEINLWRDYVKTLPPETD